MSDGAYHQPPPCVARNSASDASNLLLTFAYLVLSSVNPSRHPYWEPEATLNKTLRLRNWSRDLPYAKF